VNARTGIVVMVLSTALAACAPIGAAGGTSTGSRAVAQADRSHEYSSPPVTQHAVAGAATPTLAVAAFAVGYINWTAQTVSGRMRGLGELSVGQARSLVTLTAAQTARDYELRRGGVANTGIVEAIAPVIGQADTYAVVTRERTTATGTDAYRGLAPSWHIALATVIGTAHGGWVVSSWQPES